MQVNSAEATIHKAITRVIPMLVLSTDIGRW